MNIIVIKPIENPAIDDVVIKQVPHQDILGRSNLKIPPDNGNQHKFVIKLLQASYGLVSAEDVNSENLKIRNYGNSGGFDLNEIKNYNDNFQPIKNLCIEESEKIDKMNRKNFFKIHREPLYKKQIISATDESGRYESKIFQIFHPDLVRVVAYPVVRNHIVSKNENTTRAALNRASKIPSVQSPVFYLELKDLKENNEENMFDDPVRADYLCTYPPFMDLGLLVKSNVYTNLTIK